MGRVEACAHAGPEEEELKFAIPFLKAMVIPYMTPSK